MSQSGFRLHKSTHAWKLAASHRERCALCFTIRSWDSHPEGWVYCAPGEEPTTRDPGCYQRLPGIVGAAHVDD
jgi:hypothetical protein